MKLITYFRTNRIRYGHVRSRVYRNGVWLHNREWYEPTDPEDKPLTKDWIVRVLQLEYPALFSKIKESVSLKKYLNKCQELGPVPELLVQELEPRRLVRGPIWIE